MFNETTTKDSKKLKELEILKMKSLSVFLDITKIADSWSKIADISRTQGLRHVIYIFFRSSLGKVL